MKVEFVCSKSNNNNGINAVLTAALTVAAERGYKYTVDGIWRTVHVDEWTQWLSCMYKAIAFCSRNSRPEAMKFRYCFNIHKNGFVYRTSIWLDEEVGGIRYGLAV